MDTIDQASTVDNTADQDTVVVNAASADKAIETRGVSMGKFVSTCSSGNHVTEAADMVSVASQAL